MENKKPLNIEQAGNYLKEKNKTLAADTKRRAKDAPISIAPPKDRHNYLMYGITIMTNITETLKNRWCTLADKSFAMYSTKDVCQILRKVLVLRINGYSIKRIAHHLKVTELVILQSENLAIQAIKEAIEKKKNTGIAILGGK